MFYILISLDDADIDEMNLKVQRMASTLVCLILIGFALKNFNRSYA